MMLQFRHYIGRTGRFIVYNPNPTWCRKTLEKVLVIQIG